MKDVLQKKKKIFGHTWRFQRWVEPKTSFWRFAWKIGMDVPPNKMLATNTNCWVHCRKLSVCLWQSISFDSRQLDSPSFFRKFQSFSVCIFSRGRQTKIQLQNSWSLFLVMLYKYVCLSNPAYQNMVENTKSFWKRLFTLHCTKMKFSTKDFFSKCDQILRKLRIWSHLLKKSLL